MLVEHLQIFGLVTNSPGYMDSDIACDYGVFCARRSLWLVIGVDVGG